MTFSNENLKRENSNDIFKRETQTRISNDIFKREPKIKNQNQESKNKYQSIVSFLVSLKVVPCPDIRGEVALRSNDGVGDTEHRA